jgi:hypothetical protein
MSVEEAAERLNRLRLQGEPFTSQHQLATQVGCSSGTINKAIHSKDELAAWAKPPEAAPRAVGQPRKKKPGGADQRAEPDDAEPAVAGHEADPADAAAEVELRRRIESDHEERAFVNEMARATPEFQQWYLGLGTARARRACWRRWKEWTASDPTGTRTFFFGLDGPAQIAVFDDPDRGQKIPPRP